MELERLKEFIENAEAFKTNPACQELAKQFYLLSDLIKVEKEGGTLDSAYFERFGVVFKQFWHSFDEAVMSFGMSPDVFKANLDNPAYFPPEVWQRMQALKREIYGEEKASIPKKLRKEKKKKVRI
ncbi:MAG: hypothetical protein K1X28_05535 [Parachlamydiales bacterium]|nr:hypothetical protein [Parachlamydiales bacterium]